VGTVKYQEWRSSSPLKNQEIDALFIPRTEQEQDGGSGVTGLEFPSVAGSGQHPALGQNTAHLAPHVSDRH
jgi:hypothetical protein